MEVAVPTKAEAEIPTAAPLLDSVIDVPNDAADDKAVAPAPEPKAIVEKTPDAGVKVASKGSRDRDVALAEVEKEKRTSFIKAWEENKKTKAENKAQKKLSALAAWENTKKSSAEAKLRKLEEKLEKKKADYGEKTKNKAAMIHKQAEEKRAMVEATRREEILKAEETAAKYRATGSTPKKFLGCF
ncbi:hypothetical protein I3760_01G053700 [Carya illinoinensis]|nr:hypothetical protein I3760_01G053700 [Carya illinoinensis]